MRSAHVSINGWDDKQIVVQSMTDHSVLKSNEVRTHGRTWMNLTISCSASLFWNPDHCLSQQLILIYGWVVSHSVVTIVWTPCFPVWGYWKQSYHSCVFTWLYVDTCLYFWGEMLQNIDLTKDLQLEYTKCLQLGQKTKIRNWQKIWTGTSPKEVYG